MLRIVAMNIFNIFKEACCKYTLFSGGPVEKNTLYIHINLVRCHQQIYTNYNLVVVNEA